MRSLLQITVLLLSTCVFVTPAAGQSVARPNSWNLTPFLHTTIDVSDPAPDNSLGLGFAVGYDWTSSIGFEGEVSHLFDVAGDSADVDWSVTTFSANVLYHFNVQRVTPYATFGLGFERSNHGFDDVFDLPDLSANELTVNFGGGVKYPLNDRWLVRGDLRRFAANDLAPDHWRLYGGLTYNLGR